MTKFWNARKAGKNIEESAFETFTGQWAKQNGFIKISYKKARDIKENKVVIKLLKL